MQMPIFVQVKDKIHILMVSSSCAGVIMIMTEGILAAVGYRKLFFCLRYIFRKTSYLTVNNKSIILTNTLWQGEISLNKYSLFTVNISASMVMSF